LSQVREGFRAGPVMAALSLLMARVMVWLLLSSGDIFLIQSSQISAVIGLLRRC